MGNAGLADKGQRVLGQLNGAGQVSNMVPIGLDWVTRMVADGEAAAGDDVDPRQARHQPNGQGGQNLQHP